MVLFEQQIAKLDCSTCHVLFERHSRLSRHSMLWLPKTRPWRLSSSNLSSEAATHAMLCMSGGLRSDPCYNKPIPAVAARQFDWCHSRLSRHSKPLPPKRRS